MAKAKEGRNKLFRRRLAKGLEQCQSDRENMVYDLDILGNEL